MVFLLYGSYLTGVNTETSDIDLHIILDNEDLEHLIRGNKIIDGTRIEYFEKPILDVYETVEEGIEKNSSLWRESLMEIAFRNEYEPVFFLSKSQVEPAEEEHKEKWLK